MSDVIVFHHAHGLTAGVLAFADELRAAGHRVVAPDLYDGATFDTLQAGMAHAETIGFDAIIARGLAAADALPPDTVYIGFSLGVMPAQKLAQTRAGAKGAVLVSACVPLEYFGPWPSGLPVQVHVMESDALGDVDVAREFSATIESAELFLYDGGVHLFADSSLSEYEASAANVLMERVLELLKGVSRHHAGS